MNVKRPWKPRMTEAEERQRAERARRAAEVQRMLDWWMEEKRWAEEEERRIRREIDPYGIGLYGAFDREPGED